MTMIYRWWMTFFWWRITFMSSWSMMMMMISFFSIKRNFFKFKINRFYQSNRDDSRCLGFLSRWWWCDDGEWCRLDLSSFDSDRSYNENFRNSLQKFHLYSFAIMSFLILGKPSSFFFKQLRFTLLKWTHNRFEIQ